MDRMPRSLVVVLILLVSTAPIVRPTPQSDNLQDACNKTLFPKVCIQSLTTNPETRTADARRLAELSVYVAKEVGTTVAAFAHHELSGVKEDILFKCLDSCSDDIEETVAHLSALTRELTDAKFLEVKSWLSATLGGTSTCEESCKDAPISDIKNAVVTKSLEFEKLLRVTLDLITEASGSMSADVAVPPTAWDASAPGGSYGATAPESSFGATAPESSEGASAPGAEEPSTDSAPAPSTEAPSADVPSSSAPSAEAPESGEAGAPSPSPSTAAGAPEADSTA
jgi:pectinesterase inhibitor-like protein